MQRVRSLGAKAGAGPGRACGVAPGRWLALTGWARPRGGSGAVARPHASGCQCRPCALRDLRT
eukprot:1764294-Pleurochrysis_carterae.AAC.2